MHRRNFIMSSAIAAAGMIQHNSLFASASVKPIKIALIGCGDRGKGILSVINTLPALFQIVAICDVLPFRVEETRKLKRSSWYEVSDYKRIIDDRNIDAVVIATPLNLHFEIASAALQAGKNVFLEKTMTYSIEEAISLTRLVKSLPNQVLQVGHQYRYVPLYFRVKEMIEKGYLGKVTQIDCRWDRNWNWRRPVPEPSLERKINWRMYKEYSGGLVAELLSHQIDFINWAFETHPDEIMGSGGIDNFPDGRETCDNVQVICRYDKIGMIGNFGATCSNSREGYIFKIKGTKGTVELLVNEGLFYPEPETRKQLETVDGVTSATRIEWTKDGGIPILNEKAKDGTLFAVQDFYKAISERIQPASNVVTGATTAITVHLANDAIYSRSIKYWKNEYNLEN